MKLRSSKLGSFLAIVKRRLPLHAIFSLGVSSRNFLLTWLIAVVGSRVITVVERGTIADLTTDLWFFAAILIGYAVADTIFLCLQSVSTQKIENDIRYACLRGILFTSFPNSQKIGNRGEFLSRINRDTGSAVGLLSGGLVMVAMCVISGIGATVVIARECVLACAALYVLGMAGFFLQNYLTKQIKSLSQKQRSIQSRAMSLYLQIHTRSADLKLSGKADYAVKLYCSELEQYRKVAQTAAFFSGLSEGVSGGVLLLGILGALALCIYAYATNDASLDSAVLVSQMSSLVISMALYLYNFLTSLRGSMVGVERVLELSQLPREDFAGADLDLSNTSSCLVQANSVVCTFENDVSITYGCTIPRNQLVALVGESGCGKTTLLRLMLKLYLFCGALRIGNSDVKCCSAQSLRNAIAYVPQENPPLGGTMREVLLFGNPNHCSDQELWQALEYVGADVWIGKLDSGLDTIISDGGANLSGGQRQMLTIARAVLYHRPILVLDEAFSGLDDAHVDLILKRLKALCNKSSVIVVTHDERIRALCDTCVEL